MVIAVMCSSCSSGRYAANVDYLPVTDTGYTPAGALEEVFYRPSEGCISEKRMLVYLPEGYYSSTERYPVLYLLHGARGNETSWIRKGHLLHETDSLRASRLIGEFIIVMPNMNDYDNEADFGRSREKNVWESAFEIDGDVEYFFIHDIVNTVDSLFRTIPDKSHRALAGLSIGGFQAIHISASYPDDFSYIGIFSPVTGTVISHGTHSRIFRGLHHKLETLFTSDRPELYWIMIGKGDFLYSRVADFADGLKRLGYDFEFITSKGGHDWDNWRAYCNIFMQQLWK